jgi:FMN phosphatase YigB (HAD superfamily)
VASSKRETTKMPCKAVIFDYIGTLVNCKNYTMEASKLKLHNALRAQGFDAEEKRFLDAYNLAHEKYRKIRYGQLREVTNAVWVAETLCNLGFEVLADDCRIRVALNIFFQDFIDTLELRESAKNLLRQAKEQFKVGLISNFTYAPIIYKSMGKLGIREFFSAVVVSEEVSWRKPSAKIFQDALNRLHVQACEAIFIGDNPIEDIKGAKDSGLKTVFVPSQFNTLKNLLENQQKPDCIEKNLTTICQNLNQIINF